MNLGVSMKNCLSSQPSIFSTASLIAIIKCFFNLMVFISCLSLEQDALLDHLLLVRWFPGSVVPNVTVPRVHKY